MILWSEMDWLYRFLVIAMCASVVHFIFIAPQDYEHGGVAALLIGVTFIYHHILLWKLSRKRKEELNVIHKAEPRLQGDPKYSDAGSITAENQYELLDVETGRSMGMIHGCLLSELIKAHDEWGLKSNDFFILFESLDMLKDSGYSNELVSFLRQLLAGQDSIEVRWVDNKAKQ